MKPGKITYLNYPPGTFICRSDGRSSWVGLVTTSGRVSPCPPDDDPKVTCELATAVAHSRDITLTSIKPGDTNYDAWWAWWVAVQLGAKQELPA